MNQIAGHMTLWSPVAKAAPSRGDENTTGLAALTEREGEVLALVAAGLSNQQIGDRLFIAERTVRTHVSTILGKLNLPNRTQATLIALEQGLTPGATKPVYRHRNGEAEPPLQTGGYWMEVPEPLARDYILLAQAPWGEWRMRSSNGDWEPYRPHHLRMLRARFWGPNDPPWEP